MTKLPAKNQDYRNLRDDLRGLLEKGRIQAERAVSEIANRTYWNVGKRLGAQRAATDAQGSVGFMRRLAADLGVAPSLLYHSVKFYKAYPRGLPKSPDAANLSWGAHLALLPIKDDNERLFYIGRAIDEGWSRSKLRRAIRSGLYAHETGRSGKVPSAALDRPTSGLHTYFGMIEKIIDGDTLDVRIDLGFDVWRVERIRLRGIDTPEMDTQAGQAAKSFVIKTLKDVKTVAFKTYKTDIYARYIADVFYAPPECEKAQIFETGRFLNQEILAAGHAVVMN
ncbi:MAG TPA: DUF1016 N-terminal domain-containing protein [Myxococcota bacterium]|nr:DUF1016 N-terminal domain-containing protein [Myxococcota bacterium]